MNRLFQSFIFVALICFLCSCGENDNATYSILTYNLCYKCKSIDPAIELIKEKNPDILCFQEVIPKFADRFSRELGKDYPYRMIKPRKGTWGVGIASRFPIRGAQTFEQKPHRMPGAEAIVSLPQGEVRVSCLHLFPPSAKRKKNISTWRSMKDNSVLRKQQADSILARYKKETRPVLIIGDINETGFGKVSSIFKKGGFESACGVGGYACAPTWPGPSYLLPPVFQIDQIWGRKVRFLGAETILKGKSDHYPVMAYFRLQN